MNTTLINSFQPLKGKEHTKEYLKNKSYRSQYKQWKTDQINRYIDILSIGTHKINDNKTTMFYIISASLYKSNHYQLTTFVHGKPFSHGTYKDIHELINANTMILHHSIEESIY